MRKSLIITALLVFACLNEAYGQSFDWNIRGGLNLMKAQTSGKDLSILYHAGLQAGVRITSFGFYGEAVYSMHENQYSGGEPIGYLIPSLVVKGFWRKHLFAEFGVSYLSKIGDSGHDPDTMNPDKKAFMMAGLGAQFSKFQLSLRSTVKPSTSYGVIQLTGAFSF